MKKKANVHLYIIAIVGIVAIIGIVLMLLNSNRNLIGNAALPMLKAHGHCAPITLGAPNQSGIPACMEQVLGRLCYSDGDCVAACEYYCQHDYVNANVNAY